jgi:hypothetical protein
LLTQAFGLVGSIVDQDPYFNFCGITKNSGPFLFTQFLFLPTVGPFFFGICVII